ncbi:MAG: thiol-disulfide isomerase/thioredoxin [Bacillariaceae sp.]|jgi:thiol-disulfide isomerase/thioredoxin
MRSSIPFNAFLCITGNIGNLVGAFQPARQHQQQQQQQRLHNIIRHNNNHPLFSSSSYLSSLSSSTTSVSNETNNKSATASSVTVIGYNNNNNNNHEEDNSMQSQTTATTTTTTTHSSSPPAQVAEQTAAPVDIPPKKKFVHIPNKNKNPVIIASTMQELLDAMNNIDNNIDNNNDNDSIKNNIKSSGMSLILYHASYCKICQRAGMQLIRASKEYPSVKFAKIEASIFPDPATPKLKSLGVTKFPFIQIYRYGKCVASFSTGPTHMFMRRVRDTLDLCLERDEECWNNFVTEFSNEIESNQLSRNNLLSPDDEVDEEAAQPLP